jgi:hypothetical protein
MKKYPALILQVLYDHQRWQRLDGLRCESKVINLSGFAFRWSMRWLRWKGYVETFRDKSPLLSVRRLPYYRITPLGIKSFNKHCIETTGAYHYE